MWDVSHIDGCGGSYRSRSLVRQRKKQPIILFLDNRYRLICMGCTSLFTPHTSHRLYPRTCIVFGFFKSHYNGTVNDLMSCKPGKPQSISEFVVVIGSAFPLAITTQNIISGFDTSGIVPLNEDIFANDHFFSP